MSVLWHLWLPSKPSYASVEGLPLCPGGQGLLTVETVLLWTRQLQFEVIHLVAASSPGGCSPRRRYRSGYRLWQVSDCGSCLDVRCAAAEAEAYPVRLSMLAYRSQGERTSLPETLTISLPMVKVVRGYGKVDGRWMRRRVGERRVGGGVVATARVLRCYGARSEPGSSARRVR